LALGLSMVLTDRWFTEVDDECAIIDVAAHPVRGTLQVFLSGAGQHEHPPLYDLILHGWLRLTAGAEPLLRVPSIAFFLLGLWVLIRLADRMGGTRSANAVAILGVAWPYGFHFGRLATWYSFSFLLVALLTWAYLKLVDGPTKVGWVTVFLVSLALVYTNYFGWVLLGCLAVDCVLRQRAQLQRWWQPLVGTGVLLVVAYLPILRAFRRQLSTSLQPEHSLSSVLFSGVYSLYSVFVSESVAPWFWPLSIPAGVAIVVCLIVTFLRAPSSARNFLLYFLFSIALMAALGIVNTKRLLLIAPWLLLPIALAIAGAGHPMGTRYGASLRALVASLVVITAVGWYGVATRRFYAAPRWIEPWRQVAGQAADVVRGGGLVIGNNPSFFFYLTYALGDPQRERPGTFRGLLPNSVTYPRVYSPRQWDEAGRPAGSTTLVVNGLHFRTPSASTDEAERWLGQNCQQVGSQRMVPDPGSSIKQRYSSGVEQPPWRIVVLAYHCPVSGPANERSQ
jgi:hypothetical protein